MQFSYLTPQSPGTGTFPKTRTATASWSLVDCHTQNVYLLKTLVFSHCSAQVLAFQLYLNFCERLSCIMVIVFGYLNGVV